MQIYNRKRAELNTHAHARTHTRTHTHARTHGRTHARTVARRHAHTHARTRAHTHTLVLKVKKQGLTETRTRIKEKKYLLSKLLNVTYIMMIMYYVTPMMPLYNGFYLFPLSRAVNLNRLIFDPSEVEFHQY